MTNEALILKTLKQEVVPAMGCTEPVAVALAVSKAKELLKLTSKDFNQIKRIRAGVSPNIFKNGLGVGIPGTNEVGLVIATALGFTAGNSSDGLEVLKNVHETEIQSAHHMISKGQIQLDMLDTDEKIKIEVILETNSGYAKIVIAKRHNHFVHLESHEGVLLTQKEGSSKETTYDQPFDLTLEEIIEGVKAIPTESLSFLLEGLSMNKAIAEVGLSKKCGIGVGYVLNQQAENGLLGKDLMNRAMAVTAAASDARMSGVLMPVMSSNGSGNNGLTAILPLVAYAEKFDVNPSDMARAVAISHLINSKIKGAIGRLSAICGCGVAAGTGASVAIAWLMGASLAQMDGVVQNMIANTAGMICDGAKTGCALKLATSASAAVQSALLSVNDAFTPPNNGILGRNAEESIHNLGRLSMEAMMNVDAVVIDIMKHYKS
ncbi:L-cysteine desulfidase family protein [Fusibacter tunisiensis]|uniref:UPF0597 protein JOC49_002434 n=1 Tax=Fusibacter tunisiensis TaxID=1008308 RepID=A0ABS2MTX2_9FIRM|nr:L-serine ammonia-lyase, iron-sulfur-dependent, subunit alpha [Fusibacter tunisiensis]MBM7562861.1 L-cysteine desulfidase [Fusibacter tunisiensis]